jgi:hypothetical protein
VQIWNGRPDEPGSQIVWGDLTTNRLINSVWSGIYRAPFSNLLADDRAIQQHEVSVGTTLPEGHYWLDWTIGAHLDQGPWVPPITRQGVPGSGNALQFYGSTQQWNQAFDKGGIWQDDLPFTLFSPDAQTVTVTPISVVPGPGVILSGDFGSLAANDEIKLVMRPGPVLTSAQRPIGATIEGIAPGSAPTSLSIVVDASGSAPGVNLLVETFVWGSTAFSTVGNVTLTTSDTTTSFLIPSPLSSIGPSNRLRMRLTARAGGPVLIYPWLLRIDEATWRYTP